VAGSLSAAPSCRVTLLSRGNENSSFCIVDTVEIAIIVVGVATHGTIMPTSHATSTHVRPHRQPAKDASISLFLLELGYKFMRKEGGYGKPEDHLLVFLLINNLYE